MTGQVAGVQNTHTINLNIKTPCDNLNFVNLNYDGALSNSLSYVVTDYSASQPYAIQFSQAILATRDFNKDWCGNIEGPILSVALNRDFLIQSLDELQDMFDVLQFNE